MAFKDFTQVCSPPLVLPINGKDYTIPPVGIADGLRLETEELSNDETFTLVLGAAGEQMRTDNVPAEAYSRAFMAALADHQVGRAAAEAVWETGAVPKSLAEMVKEAAERQSTDSPPSPNSASASKTPRRGSSRATTSPSGTRRSAATRQPPARATRSRGSKSSTSGG